MIKKHKKEIIIISFLILIIYTSFQTFLTSDDLVYSFMKNKDIRITNLTQIITNNMREYNSWTGRIIIHCIVQILLIFGKNLWSIINPTIITLAIVFVTFIEKKLSKEHEYTILLLINITLFLSMTDIKYLTYWVAGSVNYIWPLALILYYTYRNIEEEYENYPLLFIISILQELSLTYILTFTIIKIYNKYKKNKKLDLTPLIPIILGGSILLGAPGNFKRLNMQETNNVIIEYITSLRSTLKLVFNIRQPLILIYLIINILRQPKKSKYKYIVLLVLAQCECLFYIPIILLSIKQTYNKTITISFYSTMLFMTLIPTYEGIHPYIYIFTYMIIEIGAYLIKLKNQKALLLLLTITTIIHGGIEYRIYNEIGQVKRERISSIEQAKKTNNKIIKLKKIKNEKYLIDGNGSDETMDTKKYIKEYYRLNNDVQIEFVE